MVSVGGYFPPPKKQKSECNVLTDNYSRVFLSHRSLKLLEYDVVVHNDAAPAEGLHLDPVEGLAQGGLEVDALQLKEK